MKRSFKAAIILLSVLGGPSAATASAAPIAYVSAGTGTQTLYTVDLASQAVTPIGLLTEPSPVEGLAMSGGKQLYAIGGGNSPRLTRIDKSDGQGESHFNLSSLNGTVEAMPSLAFGPEESLWASSLKFEPSGEIISRLHRIRPEISGVETIGRAGGETTTLGGLAGSCDGSMYAAVETSGLLLEKIDLQNAALTEVGPLSGPSPGEDLELAMDHETETLYALSRGGDLYKIDPATGTGSLVGPLMLGVSRLTEVSGFTIDSPAACPPPEPPGTGGGSGSGGGPGPAGIAGGPPQEIPPAPEAHCVVPKLKGKTLRGARVALKAADCRLGKVRKPKGAKPRRLVVKSSSPASGSVLPADATVTLKMTKASR